MSRTLLLLIYSLMPLSAFGTQFLVGAAQKQLARYSSFTASRPISSHMIQGGVLFVAGDVLAQLMQPEQDPNERTPAKKCRRTLTSGAFGAFYIGLASAQWYRLMDHIMPGQEKVHLIGKVIANSVVLGVFGNAANVYCRRYARSGNAKEAIAYTKKYICPIIMHDFRIWPAFDVVCFSFIPLQLRPTSAGIMSLGWNTYMSLASNKKQ